MTTYNSPKAMNTRTSSSKRRARAAVTATALLLIMSSPGSGPSCSSVEAFTASHTPLTTSTSQRLDLQLSCKQRQDSCVNNNCNDCPNNNNSNNNHNDKPHNIQSPLQKQATKILSSIAVTTALSASILLSTASTIMPQAALAENELSAKYGNRGFDTSLVDQNCLVDKCSLQAKACLADDPDCRKGLTCTAKCLGDNACITGCMARYGDSNLDDLLKCTIEDHECIKVAILDGGADKFGEEPRPPAPTVKNFNLNSMQGSWYKVVGFNPNYDCYACQRNTFSVPDNGNSVFGASILGQPNDKLTMDVEFSMPRMMPDGTPPPPMNQRESITEENGLMYGSQSIGFNDYETHEIMVFDKPQVNNRNSNANNLVLNKGKEHEASYARTAHSEGEMFGLKFWENWYIIGENDPGQEEFKFVYYNGKTRQNTYDGAFVYSRKKELDPEAMKKVYKIASEAGMNPDQFCKIRNGCFKDEVPDTTTGLGSPSNPFRGIIASTKVSQLLGVEPVAAEGVLKNTKTATVKARMGVDIDDQVGQNKRRWWHEAGDYLEDPHRHFRVMDSLRQPMVWPEYVKEQQQQ